uniref:DNA polymerase delta 4, accessory subunit n=1 Tax=Canis lupus familiaris TaxID=9615 RepID=A0A8I3S0Z5_CANLF
MHTQRPSPHPHIRASILTHPGQTCSPPPSPCLHLAAPHPPTRPKVGTDTQGAASCIVVHWAWACSHGFLPVLSIGDSWGMLACLCAGALAPPCSASPQSHWGPRAWPLHPENLRPHPLPGAPTPQFGWDLREEPQPLSVDEAELELLRQFDLAWQYGPCTGITRLQRWHRAEQMGLEPPPEVRQVLQTHPGDPRFQCRSETGQEGFQGSQGFHQAPPACWPAGWGLP